MRLGTKKWFDFKDIKLTFWESMREFVKNSSDVQLNSDNEVIHADIGSYDIEEYTKELRSLLKANFALHGLKTCKIQLKIWETGKYGILDDDGVC